MVAPELCPDCGGEVVLTARPGRTHRIKGGARVPVPSDLPIPTCQTCATEWMDDATAQALSALGRR